MEDRIFVFQLVRGIYLCMVRVDCDPWLSIAVLSCESCVSGCIPLHRRTSIVTGVNLDDAQRVRRGHSLILKDLIIVQALHITEL